MLGLLQRWRPGNVSVPSSTALRNPATHVTAKELIDLQQQARRLDLARHQPARARLTGNHASNFRGRGMDYQESRTYQPGDDIRNMDWRVTARTGRPHTKLFQEERERPVFLFLDLGPSLFFATRGALKSVIAARAAALLGWTTVLHGDRIGALLFNGGHHELKPRSGQRGVMPLIHTLLAQTDPVTARDSAIHPGALNEALVRLRRIVRPGSLVFLISDFYGLDEETGNHLLHLQHHNDLAAIQIIDPIELTVPPSDRYGITDGLHSGVLDTRSRRGRQHYEKFFRHYHQRLQNTLQKRAIPLLQLSTTDDVATVFQARFGKPRRQPGAGRAAA
jgi:uncharacterized protein (DUF58 family)